MTAMSVQRGSNPGFRRGRIGLMAMTAQVKAELAHTNVTKSCCRKAEVSSMLRFAGGLHIVRVVKDGEALARQTGLLDNRGRPVRGLPPQVVSGSGCDSVAAWRGAFLAHGSLTEPGRSSALEVTCPGPEAALALVGAARRHGIPAKAREVRGVDRVVIRDGDGISALLSRLGAHESLLAWEERRAGGLCFDVAERCARPPTGWRTSMTPTCGGRPARLLRPVPGWSGPLTSWAKKCPTTSRWPGRYGSSTARPASRSWGSSMTRR